MVAGIELGKKYAQICVKTESMKDAESVTKIAGTEHYRIPVEVNIEDKNELQELFRMLWKMLTPYGSREQLTCLAFCLEDNSGKMREILLDIIKIYNILPEKVHFLDKAESFCTYVMHQSAELLTHNALLIENREGNLDKFLLHKRSQKGFPIAEVRDISEKSLESVFADHGISSVFLVGDDFEEEWIQKNLKLLKTGKRVFMGKNLYVKGACYRGMEFKEEQFTHMYLGKEKVCAHIALRAEQDGKEVYVSVIEGGKNWYESSTSLDVLLLEEPVLEFAVIPINGQERKTSVIHLQNLPKRPKKTTKLRIDLKVVSPTLAKLKIKDLGFGELFPQSEMVYEGELQWD